MAVRTGQQFLDGLNDGREVWYDGQRVANVAEFAPFKAAVKSTAKLYDLQHHPRFSEILTVESPAIGERIARPYEIPRTRDHLHLKREAYVVWAEATCEMMAALAPKKSFFAECAPARAEAVVGYYRHIAKHDLFLTHALLDTQLDKGMARHQQSDPSIPLRVVDRNKDGLIVHGIKRIATAAALCR